MNSALTKVRPLDRPETGLPARLAEFLRAQHPHHTVKAVMSALAAVGEHVGADTVKNWVGGEKWPTWPSHLEALLRAYGADLADAVFGPSVLDAIELEARALATERRRLAEREAHLAAARQNRRQFLGKA
ncbi:hypothetical protein V7S57_02305 [Caulobacter sp. CCNWLY153]|uniref:hypothetical protein n=1 Tax=unclassified Caulobacter TaxID=2648921 RepID=UPI002FF2C4BB